MNLIKCEIAEMWRKTYFASIYFNFHSKNDKKWCFDHILLLSKQCNLPTSFSFSSKGSGPHLIPYPLWTSLYTQNYQGPFHFICTELSGLISEHYTESYKLLELRELIKFHHKVRKLFIWWRFKTSLRSNE